MMKQLLITLTLFLGSLSYIYSQVTADPSTVYEGESIRFVYASDPTANVLWERYDSETSNWIPFEGGPGFTDILQSTSGWKSGTVRCSVMFTGETSFTYVGSVNITIFPSLDQGTITGETLICPQTLPGTYSFSNAPAGGNGSISYQWQVSTDQSSWDNVSNQSTYTPSTINPNKTYIRCLVSAGAGQISTNTITLKVDNSFTQTIGNNQIICYGAKPNALAQNLFDGGKAPFTYQWQYSSSNNIWDNVASSGTGSTFSPDTLYSTIDYKRIVTDVCGIKDTSNVISIDVRDKIVPNISKKDVYCKEDTIIVRITNPLVQNRWYGPKKDFIKDNDSLFIGQLSESQVYYFQNIDANGCSSDMVEVPLTIDLIKADFEVDTNRIMQHEKQLFINKSINGSSYIWTLKGGLESNIKDSLIFQYDSVGAYDITLIAISNNLCADTCSKTDVFRVVPLSSVNEELANTIKIFPQPACNVLNIELVNNLNVQLTIFSMSGVRVKECSLLNKHNSIDISDLKKGVYILNIRSDIGEEYSSAILKE